MNLEELKTQLPDYAKDIKLNLASVLTEEGAPGLSQVQIYAITLASAIATNNSALINATLKTTDIHLTDAEINGAKAAATIMSMNNIYYRFIHLAR